MRSILPFRGRATARLNLPRKAGASYSGCLRRRGGASQAAAASNKPMSLQGTRKSLPMSLTTRASRRSKTKSLLCPMSSRLSSTTMHDASQSSRSRTCVRHSSVPHKCRGSCTHCRHTLMETRQAPRWRRCRRRNRRTGKRRCVRCRKCMVRRHPGFQVAQQRRASWTLCHTQRTRAAQARRLQAQPSRAGAASLSRRAA